MKEVQAIFFDFDGVILESVDVKGWAFRELFKDYPEHMDEIVSFHYANGGMSRFDKFRYFYKNIFKKPLDDKEFTRLCEEFALIVCHRVLECDFVPGAIEFIQTYYQKIPLFIITGTPQNEILMIVKEKELNHYFQGIFGSPTPKEVWVKKILKDRNLRASKVVFVGDAMSDYYAAKENGLCFVARVKDTESNIFKGKKIDHKIKDLFELHRLIV